MNPSLKRFQLSPQKYLKSLTEITKNEMRKKGVCIDLSELERREIEREWSVGEEIEDRQDD